MVQSDKKLQYLIKYDSKSPLVAAIISIVAALFLIAELIYVETSTEETIFEIFGITDLLFQFLLPVIAVGVFAYAIFSKNKNNFIISAVAVGLACISFAQEALSGYLATWNIVLCLLVYVAVLALYILSALNIFEGKEILILLLISVLIVQICIEINWLIVTKATALSFDEIAGRLSTLAFIIAPIYYLSAWKKKSTIVHSKSKRK